MPKKIQCLVLALSLLSAGSAFAQFTSNKSVVEPRGPGGLDVPSKQVDLVPATPQPVPQTPKKVEDKAKAPPAPPASSGY